MQLVGSTPQQAGRSTTVEETADARPAAHVGTVRQHGQPPKCQVTIVGGGGSPPSSPDRGESDSDGYSTASEATGCWCHHRGHRGSGEKKWLAPARLDMPIFKSTDPGAEVTYTLWHFNKRNYDAMIRTLYEVQQKEDEMVEEYMLRIHNVVMVICHTNPEHLPDCGRDLKKYHFYHGLCPYVHDALSFAMVELPKREQAHPMFNTLYTLAKKLEAGQLVRAHCYAPGSDAYQEKYRCYPTLTGRVVALEEEGVALANPTSGEDS